MDGYYEHRKKFLVKTDNGVEDTHGKEKTCDTDFVS